MAVKVAFILLLSIVQYTIVSSNSVQGRALQGGAPVVQGLENGIDGANSQAGSIAEAGSPANNLNGKEQSMVQQNQNVGAYNNYGRNPVNPSASGYAYSGYTGQEASVYGAPQPHSAPVFGISSNGDISLSAYFGPAFWGCLTGVVAVTLIIMLIQYVGGFQLLGDTFRGINEKTGLAKGKSIDLDKLSAMVYTALDHYGKWNNKSSDKYV